MPILKFFLLADTDTCIFIKFVIFEIPKEYVLAFFVLACKACLKQGN